MSEYQYHEWQAVDRVLPPEEQASVNDLPSHIEVSSSRAVVTYHWSDFRHDPKQVLLRFFDAYFYLANWGSLRLMFRFPKGLLDEADILPYCIDEFITFETIGKYQVLDLDFSPEEGEGWMKADAGLSHFIHLRADLPEGDFRLLYLAWLKAMTFYGEPNDDEGYEHDDTDIAAYYRELIGHLPREECDDFLARLAEGDPGVGLALRKRLGAYQPQERPQPAGRR